MELRELKKYGEVKVNQELKNYTTYKVGGLVDYIIFPDSFDNLIKLIEYLNNIKKEYFILGNGSNCVFNDTKFNKVIIKLNKLNNVEIDKNKVICDAGASIIKISLDTAKQGLSGFEFASGIPGTIGGAIYMNAGAYNSDISAILESVDVLKNGKLLTLNNKKCKFGYRDSIFKHDKEYIILRATFNLVESNKDSILKLIEDRKRRRLESQPIEYPSAGSVFRNPENDYAGKIIEELGYKGKSIGGAYVSDKHANFIINKDSAKAMDIYNLVNKIKQEVKEKYDINLICEQEFHNF